MGHVRDLPKSKIGVDIEAGFVPEYQVIKGKEKQIKELQAASRKADSTLLAADPDREGEAIAWHIAQALKLDNPDRVVFHEITKGAVDAALARPAQDRPRAGLRAGGAPGHRPARRLQAQPAALAQGPHRPVRRAACSRSRCGWSSTARPRSTPSSPRSSWTVDAILEKAADAVCGATGRQARRHPGGRRRQARARHRGGGHGPSPRRSASTPTDTPPRATPAFTVRGRREPRDLAAGRRSRTPRAPCSRTPARACASRLAHHEHRAAALRGRRAGQRRARSG